jgi:hypothetical protein
LSVVCASLWYADAGKHIAERALGLLGKVGVDRWIWSVRPSNDPTFDILRFLADESGKRVDIVLEDENQPADRLERLSKAGDGVLGMVGDEDFCLWHESDLLTYPTVAYDLIYAAHMNSLAACGGWTYLSHSESDPLLQLNTPAAMKLPKPIKYDSWGYRAGGGVRFSNNPPYHELYPEKGDLVFVGMDSVGSVVLINGDYIRQGPRMNGNGLVGLCEGIRSRGGVIGFAPWIPVVQPVQLWRYEND